MASSFSVQIPGIIHLITKLAPKSVLDIGKGFGKYGFLIHEYCGIPNTNKLDPSKKMKEQSEVVIDAVEVDPDLMMPHLEHFYNKVYFGDVLKLYPELPKYDLVVMIDIIEHINKEQAIEMLKTFLSNGSKVIVATPVDFFEQHLYESEYENHVSHWTKGDFEKIANVDMQIYTSGAVYLLSKEKLDIVGWGNGFMKRLKRIGWAVRNELK